MVLLLLATTVIIFFEFFIISGRFFGPGAGFIGGVGASMMFLLLIGFKLKRRRI